MGLELARAYVVARGDVSNVARDFQSGQPAVEQAAMSLQQSVNRILAGIGVGISAAVIARQVKSFLMLAGGFEQTTIAFETMIGSAEETKKTLADLTEFAAKTPFEMPEIESAARGLIMFGERGKDLMDTLNILGDAAAGTSTPFGFLALVFNQVRGVGKLLTQDFRQLSTRGVLSLQDLAKYYKVTTAEAQKMLSGGKVSFEDFRDILKVASEEGGRFANLMEKQSTSYLGLISTWKDAVGLVKRSLGEALVPAAKEFVIQGIEVTEVVRQWVTENKNLSAGIVVLTGGLVGLSGAMLMSNMATKVFILTMEKLKIALAAMVAHPVIATLVAIAAAAALVAIEWGKVNVLIEEGNEISAQFVERGKKREESLAKQVSQLLKLSKAEKLNNDEIKEAQEIIDDLEGMYGSLGLKIDKATGSILGMAKAQELLGEKNNKMQMVPLKVMLADLTKQYQEAKEKANSFFSNQGAAVEKMAELEKRISAVRKELYRLESAPPVIPGIDEGGDGISEEATELGEKLTEGIKGLDVSTAVKDFQSLKKQVVDITLEFPELAVAAKQFLQLQWEKTPLGEIQNKFKDIRFEIEGLRHGWKDWQIELMKFAQMPGVTVPKLIEMKKDLLEREQWKKRRSEDQRFETMSKQMKADIKTPTENMQEFATSIAVLMDRGRAGLSGGLTQEEGIKRLQMERQRVEGGLQSQSNEPMAGAGRFGFAEYGKAIQNMFLKSDDPAKDTARNTKQANELLGTIDRGIQVLISKPLNAAIYSE